MVLNGRDLCFKSEGHMFKVELRPRHKLTGVEGGNILAREQYENILGLFELPHKGAVLSCQECLA